MRRGQLFSAAASATSSATTSASARLFLGVRSIGSASSAAANLPKIVQLPRDFTRRRAAMQFVQNQEARQRAQQSTPVAQVQQQQQQQHTQQQQTVLSTSSSSTNLLGHDLRPLPRILQMINEKADAALADDNDGDTPAGKKQERSATTESAERRNRAGIAAAAEDIIHEFRSTFQLQVEEANKTATSASAAEESDGLAIPERPLSRYCGNMGDVIPFATIIMRACADTNDVDTARFLFALVLREFGAELQLIPFAFCRLYLVALSRSDTTTHREVNTLLAVMQHCCAGGGKRGASAVQRSGVVQLCLLEIALRAGTAVPLASVETAIRAARESVAAGDDDAAEQRLKLRDCFTCALTVHPDVAVPTLLLQEWTKLSELNEFVGELPLVARFVRNAANNASASAALCSQLLGLLCGLAKSAMTTTTTTAATATSSRNSNASEPNRSSNDHQQDVSDGDAASATASASSPPLLDQADHDTGAALSSVLRLRVLFSCVAKAARGREWGSFAAIEHMTRCAVLVSDEPWVAPAAPGEADADAASQTARSLLLSCLGLLRMAAFVQQREYKALLDSAGAIAAQNFCLAKSTPAGLFRLAFPEDVDGSACPFFLQSVLPFRSSRSGGAEHRHAAARDLVAGEVAFPLADVPPMALVLDCARSHCEGIVEAYLARAKDDARLHPAFSAMLLVASSASANPAALRDVFLDVLSTHVADAPSSSAAAALPDKAAVCVLAAQALHASRLGAPDTARRRAVLEEIFDVLAFDCGAVQPALKAALLASLRSHGMHAAVEALVNA